MQSNATLGVSVAFATQVFFALSAAQRVSGGLKGVLFATFLFRLSLHVLGCFLGTFLDASVQFLLHLFFSGSPFGACFQRQI